MPSGKVKVVVKKDHNKPRMDQIFKSFRNSKPLLIYGEVKELRHWRPSGKNSYHIEIFSIELIPEEHVVYRQYKLRGKLIAMNGIKDKHPEDMCWNTKENGGIRYEINLFFHNNHQMRMYLEYEEYITL